jgi:hypothetical protein
MDREVVLGHAKVVEQELENLIIQVRNINLTEETDET